MAQFRPRRPQKKHQRLDMGTLLDESSVERLDNCTGILLPTQLRLVKPEPHRKLQPHPPGFAQIDALLLSDLHVRPQAEQQRATRGRRT